MRFIGLALLILIPGMLKQVVTTAVGWSTVTLFGKVPRTREPYIFAMTTGAIVWIVALIGVAVQPFAAFLVAFLPLPGRVDQVVGWYAMLALAVVIPAAVAVATLRMLEPGDRPQGVRPLAVVLLKGYPHLLSLSIILVMMSVVTIVTRLRDRGRRWTERHVPVIVEPEVYPDVLREIQQVLENGGLSVRAERAGWSLRVPIKVLTLVAGSAIKDLLTEQLTTLRSDRLEVVLHLSDLVIRGPERDVNRARALLAEQLAFSAAYLTSDARANELEDRLRSIWRDVKDHPEASVDAAVIARLEGVERDLRTLDVSYEEWEVLMREKLLIERTLLQVATGLLRAPTDLTEVTPEDMGAARLQGATAT